MIALLLKLGQWATLRPKLLCCALFVAGIAIGVPLGYSRRSPPQALQVQETASGAAFGREDLTRKTEEGPWTRETWEFGTSGGIRTHVPGFSTPASVPCGVRPAAAAPPDLDRTRDEGFTAAAPQAQGPLVLHSIERHEATATETHADRESAQSTTQTLKLTQEAGNTPTWALGASLEGAFGARILRLSVRRKILGPIWLEASAIPATRAVGAGLAIEF